MEKLVIVDGESYKDWITEISNEFKRSQIRAAVKINDEKLSAGKTVKSNFLEQA